MFGIGLPEMILIMALALIVVGPDKLPDMARSLAKGLLELKKAANSIKENLTEETGIINELKPDLEQAAKEFSRQVLDSPDNVDNAWKDLAPGEGVNPQPKDSPESDLNEPSTDPIVEATPAAAVTDELAEPTTPDQNDPPTTDQDTAPDRSTITGKPLDNPPL